MKTLLNLLPEEKKELVESKLRSRFLLWQFFLFFMLELFYLSILIGIYFILDLQVKSLQDVFGNTSSVAELSQEKKLSLFEAKFHEINEKTDKIARIEYSHLYFTHVLTLLDTAIPAGVTLTQVSTRDSVVSLVGKAAKREDLILFNDNLRAASCVNGVNMPLSNLFSQENVDFQVDFQVKRECLKK